MTGPEHYREAERRLLMAWEEDSTQARSTQLVAEAQVHATLALAAATAQVTTPADFYQPGHTYADPENPKYDWRFRCDMVTTHPEDGERTALGWRYFKGQWDAIAYGEDDWDVALVGGITDMGAQS